MGYVTLREAPERPADFGTLETSWPRFMEQDPVTAVSAIEVAVAPRWQGQGLSRVMPEPCARRPPASASSGCMRLCARRRRISVPRSRSRGTSGAGGRTGSSRIPGCGPGPLVVPGALVPIHVDVDQDHAVYVEPNVWMQHPL